LEANPPILKIPKENEGTYAIVKKYQVFRGESANGEPIDEPTEQLLFALLCTRGRSEDEANQIIKEVDERRELKITLH
jgi:hypothetical protein